MYIIKHEDGRIWMGKAEQVKVKYPWMPASFFVETFYRMDFIDKGVKAVITTSLQETTFGKIVN